MCSQKAMANGNSSIPGLATVNQPSNGLDWLIVLKLSSGMP